MKLTVVKPGAFKLDGGAMFGVVPKLLWKKLNPPDENNMCSWALRCLILEWDNRIILFDTGMGQKQDAKFKSHFHPSGTMNIVETVEAKGYKKEDITDVFITHFHFDHVGGAIQFNDVGELVPSFPNAKYWSDEEHYDWAMNPNDREKASFLKENFVPLKDLGVLDFINVEQHATWIDKIQIKYCYGHTHRMMTPMIDLPNGRKLIYCADLLPSSYHISMPFVMSYDVRPLETLKEKGLFLEQAVEEGHILFLEHDPLNECCTVKRNERGRIVLDQTLTLAQALNL